MSPVLILSVVLEPAVPVLGHLRDFVAQHVENLFDGLLVDHPAQAREGRVLGRDADRHVVVEDLDRQILAAFAEDLHLLLLEHLAGAVMGVDDVIAELELDVLDLAGDLELVGQRSFFSCLCRNGVLLRSRPACGPALVSSL
jgi:hypothetical protein